MPYVGAGVLASSLCMDKVVFKEVLAAAGVPQVPYAGVRLARWQAEPEAVQRELAVLGTPVFVKPARLGSSVGIAKVVSEVELGPALDAAFAHDSLVIVEGFSSGMEVECSVLGNGEPEASVPGEIVLKGADWYDYEAKYTPGGMELVVPARLEPHGARRGPAAGRRHLPARRLRRAWRGWTSSSRTARGCWSTSSTRCRASPRRASTRSSGRRAGVPFPELCDRLLALALERFAAERSVASSRHAATSCSNRISEISAFSAPGASLVIQTR